MQAMIITWKEWQVLSDLLRPRRLRRRRPCLRLSSIGKTAASRIHSPKKVRKKKRTHFGARLRKIESANGRQWYCYTGWQKYSGTQIMLTSKWELRLVYKVSTCLALRHKSHLQVNKICVPEYFYCPVHWGSLSICHSVPVLAWWGKNVLTNEMYPTI